jgi:hypothetical protein
VTGLKIHPERAGEVARILLSALKEGGIFGDTHLPDDAVEGTLKGLSRQKALTLITLTTALDYMRNAELLWKSAISTVNDKTTSWVFCPEEVVAKGREELARALSKHALALRKRDVDIWFTLSLTICKEFGASVEQLFRHYRFDTAKMFSEFQKRKAQFPSLSGRKIFPHWIRILRDRGLLEVKNAHLLPIPVDVHIARATFTTGCVTGVYSSKGIPETVRRRVSLVWSEGLKGSGVFPIDMFRGLWILSKRGCHYRKNGERPKLAECPVARLCVDGKVNVTSSKVEVETD